MFTREDGFMLAFAIVDVTSDDGSDPAGRSLDEYLEVSAFTRELVSGIKDDTNQRVLQRQKNSTSTS